MEWGRPPPGPPHQRHLRQKERWAEYRLFRVADAAVVVVVVGRWKLVGFAESQMREYSIEMREGSSEVRPTQPMQPHHEKVAEDDDDDGEDEIEGTVAAERRRREV